MIPELRTSRLLLRAHRLDDYAEAVAMWADESVTRHTIGRPSTPQQTWMRVLTYAGHWKLLGYGYWAVEDSATSRFIGEIGFADFKRGVDPALDGVPEMGMAFAPHAHGNGFATEALGAALAWADDALKAARTVALVQPGNAASLRVVDKCGYREAGRTIVNGLPSVIFERWRAT